MLMESHIDPGPVDKSVLYDQENHISSAIWDGQVRHELFALILFTIRVSLSITNCYEC